MAGRAPALLMWLALPALADGRADAGTVTRTLGALHFGPCTLAGGMTGQPVEAQCTTLEVPEDRAQPTGRQVSLAIALVPARRDPAPDPVFLLAGGPGQSARDSYPAIAGAFTELRKTHHLILVDQRGTGGSNKLQCEADQPDGGLSDDPAQAKGLAEAGARRCAERLSARADLRFYGTREAVEDLEAVRQALGAPTIDLVGVSYGTRVAQQYAARYPAQTRTITLDGVAPNSVVLGSDFAKNLQHSLQLQLAACTNQPRCAERLGDPNAKLQALLRQLEQHPPQVRYRDPVTGRLKDERLTRGQLAGMVRMLAYVPQAASLLPLLLDEASQGHFETLAALSRLVVGSVLDAMAMGMQLSVVCTEDAAELVADPADEGTVLGTTLVDVVKAQCAAWPHGERVKDFRAPLTTPVPALLLSGELDPVTPPAYGDQVAKGLPNARHLVVKGQGHNVLPVGCVPRLFSQFISKADAKGLDASCLDSVAVAKPFLDFYGWEP